MTWRHQYRAQAPSPTQKNRKAGSTQARVAAEMTSAEKNGLSPRKVVGMSLKVEEEGRDSWSMLISQSCMVVVVSMVFVPLMKWMTLRGDGETMI
jgi:hypothetical protein